jgi:hypothetical protein
MIVWTKQFRYFVMLCVPVLLEVLMIPSVLTTAQAQAKTPTQTSSDRSQELRLRQAQLAQTASLVRKQQSADTRLKQVQFKPSRDQPSATMMVGGGRRNDNKCSQDRKASEQLTQSQSQPLDQALTPLLPLPLTDLQLTVSTHPTFLVYVPQTSAKALEFTLFTQDQDNNEQGIYQTSVDLTSTPGIISISLPSTEPPLEMGKDYKWMVTMSCHSEGLTPEDPFAEGLIRRIQPDSALSQLDKAKPLDRVAVYAKAGFWYEALANLAALRQSRPTDPNVASAWKELLESVGLNAIANAPFKN